MRWPSPPEMRGGGAVEREVVEADGVEEFEALDDLALQAVGDDGVAAGEVQGAGDGEGALERERGEVGDGRCAAFRVLPLCDWAPLRGRDATRVTARDSGRSRLPWQRGQVVADMYCIMYSR